VLAEDRGERLPKDGFIRLLAGFLIMAIVPVQIPSISCLGS